MTRILALMALWLPGAAWGAAPIQNGSNFGLGVGGGQGVTGLSLKYFIGADFSLQSTLGVWDPLGLPNTWLLGNAYAFDRQSAGFGATFDALFESQPWISGAAVDLAFNGGMGATFAPGAGTGAGADWLGVSLVGGFEVDVEVVPVDLVIEYRPNLWLLSGLPDGSPFTDNVDWLAFVVHLRVYPFPAGPT